MNKSKVTRAMVAESGADLFESARNVGRKGLQQYFTPSDFATWCAETALGLSRWSDEACVLDPTAGAGNLLEPFAARECEVFGIELDRTVIREGLGVRQGNLQRVAPYLRELGCTWDILALNPPFGLDWDNSEGKVVNSCAETFRLAESVAADTSVAFMICDERNWKHFGAECGKWQLAAHFRLKGLFAPESECVCVVSWWGTNIYKPGTDLGDLDYSRLKSWGAEVRAEVRACWSMVPYWSNNASRERFVACCQAAEAPAPESPYNLYLKRGNIRVRFSDFEALCLYEKTRDDKLLARIRKLNGRTPSYFALNTIDADDLTKWVSAGYLTIEPALSHAIHTAVGESVKITAPYYPLKATQRLGYLDRLNEIRCIKSDPELGLEAGRKYPLTVKVAVFEERGARQTQERNALTGEFEPVGRETVRTSRNLQIIIPVSEEEGAAPLVFNETSADKEYMCEHFDIPDPGDIATHFPERYSTWVNRLRRLEGSRLSYRDFQRDDIARFSIRGSGVCGWEQGLGKMIFGLSWAEVRKLRRVLVVCPQDLIAQWTQEAASKFGIRLHRIKSIADAKAIASRPKPGPNDPPEFCIVHYEALSRNGSQYERGTIPSRWASLYKPLPGTESAELREMYERRREEIRARYYGTNNSSTETRREWLGECSGAIQFKSADCCPHCGSSLTFNGAVCNPRKKYKIGKQERRGCGYVHTSRRVHPMSYWLKKAFSAVIIDEGTKIQGGPSVKMAAGVLRLRPRLRLVLTGTPVKNYLPSAFWLLWWVNGGRATGLFPYNRLEQDKFTSDYCVQERDAPSVRNEWRAGPVRTLPELCNVNMLWKLLAPNMLRRRKSETGEKLVEKRMLPVFAPWGSEQSKVYSWWISNFAKWFCSRPGASTDNTSYVEAFSAIYGLQTKLRFCATVPGAEHLGEFGGARSWSNSTPKLLACLNLIREALEAREPVIVFNAYRDASAAIKLHLDAAGIKSRIADGEVKPADRSAMMADFRAGKFPVLLAGIEAVNLGHNLEVARRAIVFSLPWDLATFEQAINRIHRLTSKRECIVHILCTEGSIDAKMWDLVSRKGKYAGLALDGALGYEDVQETNWNEFLRELRESYQEASASVPEEVCAARIAEVFNGLHLVTNSHGHQIGAAAGLMDKVIARRPRVSMLAK